MNIETVKPFVAGDHGLATVSLTRGDGSVHSSVVNAGVLDEPTTGESAVGLVVRGDAYKLKRWRNAPQANVVFRNGWRWIGVEGTVTLYGPHDGSATVPDEAIPRLLRGVFVAAGGTHDDWDEYDRVMVAEGRTAVFVTPTRIVGSG